jgi:hypothetical protein
MHFRTLNKFLKILLEKEIREKRKMQVQYTSCLSARGLRVGA